MHVTKPLAKASHPCDHFIVDPEKAVPLGDIAQTGGVVAVRKGAAAAEHRLGDHRGNILSADGADDLLRCFQ